jgi:DNA polymerase-3 subunit beta
MVASVKSPANESPISVSTGLSVRMPRKELTSALALIARVADRRSTMPILANVLIRCDASGTTLAATDLNAYLTLRAPTWYGDRGDHTVPAKQLHDIAKSAPGSEISLTRSGPTGLRIESGGVDTTLLGMPGRDFPKVPDASELTFVAVDGKALADMIDGVLFSTCKDETRFHLNGVYIERHGAGLRVVSTDGHRLTLAQRETIGGGAIGDKGVILPSAAATTLVKLVRSEKGGAVSLAFKAPYLFVKVGGWELAAKCIDAQFPSFWQVIPTDHKRLATVDRTQLIAALKRAKAMTSDTRGVRFDIDGETFKLTSDHPDQGTVSEGIAADTSPGMKVTIGVNPKYLIELLTECDGERVTLAFGGELDPIVVRSTDHAVAYTVHDSPMVGVIMPMRI